MEITNTKSDSITLTDLVSVPIVESQHHHRKRSHRTTFDNAKSYLNLGLLVIGILVYLTIVGITISKLFLSNSNITSGENVSSALSLLNNINKDLLTIQGMSPDSKEISIRIRNSTASE